MSTIEHSTITDPNIHEPKGVAAAATGQLYVANGSGSGAWTDPSSLSFDVGTTGGFNSDFELYKEEDAGQFTDGNVWEDRSGSVAWTSATNNIASASVSTNTISLPAGTYAVEAYATFVPSSSSSTNEAYAQLRLRDVTSGTTLVKGMGLPMSTVKPTAGLTSVSGGQAILKGRFTLASTKNIRLQQYLVGASCFYQYSIGVGAAGETPRSCFLRIWKVS